MIIIMSCYLCNKPNYIGYFYDLCIRLKTFDNDTTTTNNNDTTNKVNNTDNNNNNNVNDHTNHINN